MKGRIDIRVSNNRARFRFTLERNITVVRGDSGTGKTTLYDMIAEYTRLGEDSGVQVSAPCPCVALVDMDWQNQLSHTKGSVVFIDEGAHYLASREFAAAIQQTDNYYVIFNRENLHELPYITFSPEPNVVLNSIHARKNSPIPEGSVQNDRSCQIVPNKTRPCQTESVKSPLQSGWVRYGCSPVLSSVITIYLL